MLASSRPQPSLQVPAFAAARPLLVRVIAREHLSRAEAAELFSFVLDPATTDAQIAAVLSAFATKVETAEELTGMAEVMRARATRISTRHATMVDTAGTGGSAAKTFNVSTAAAFVIAGAGLAVAKHGNRAVSSRTGSADVFSALGVNIIAPQVVMEKCLDELGLCFLFAPLYHPACARAAVVRREMGFSTAFNCLGPLVNPAGAPFQIVGVPDRVRAGTIAETLAGLGTSHSWVVSAEGGLDEISTTGITHVFDVANGLVTERWIEPSDFGFSGPEEIIPQIANPEDSAAVIRDLLGGSKGAARRLVVANAAAALHIAGIAQDLLEGVDRAEASIDSGAAQSKLDALVVATTRGEA